MNAGSSHPCREPFWRPDLQESVFEKEFCVRVNRQTPDGGVDGPGVNWSCFTGYSGRVPKFRDDETEYLEKSKEDRSWQNAKSVEMTMTRRLRFGVITSLTSLIVLNARFMRSRRPASIAGAGSSDTVSRLKVGFSVARIAGNIPECTVLPTGLETWWREADSVNLQTTERGDCVVFFGTV